MSVELYRLMYGGNLSPENDISVKYIVDFLDKINNTNYGIKLMEKRDDFGSLYVTAKRMVYSLAENILEVLNKQ